MKSNLVISVVLLLSFSCNQTNNKTEVCNKNKELVLDPKIDIKDTCVLGQPESANSGGCNFDKFISDNKTSKLVKQIYYDQDWDLNNSDDALALLDSLTAKNINSRPFYFKVVTKSYKKSDGYFSEGLGDIGASYIEKHTKEFITYFDSKDCFTDKDLETWADIVMLYFSLAGENKYSQPLIDDYTKKITLNCKDCSIQQNATIKKFSNILKSKWTNFLSNIDK